MKSLLIIWSLLIPLLASAHPIHVSVCEMEHDAENHLMKITLKIFVDDFEDVLEDRTGEAVNLGLDDEHPDTDVFITDYLNEKFYLSINGKEVAPVFEGREIEDVAIWCYLSVPDIKEVAIVTIRNHIMLHWFKDQVNVVHLDCNDKLNSTFFSSGREEETFSFK